MDGKSAMAAIDAPALTIGGRQLLINEAYSLADQVSGRGRNTPKIDISERLYVTGLAKGVTESMLRTLFNRHGFQVLEVYVPKRKVSGGNKGFGFVTMGSRSEAVQAIGALNGALLDGTRVSVRPAEPR